MDFAPTNILHNLAGLFAYDPTQPLMFSSGLFWVLFLLFLPIYAALKSRRTQMMLFVSAFSLYFFYKSSGWYLLFMVFTGTLDWLLAQYIHDNASHSRRKMLLLLSIFCSVGLLIGFKYTNFVLWNIDALLQRNFQPLDIIMPVGISFYTFRTISYVVDVYKGKLQPTDSLLEYLFFITYFPCLIAGPIARANDFLPQLRANKSATRAMIYGGLWLVLLGVLKKAVAADYIAQYVNIAFDNPGGYSGVELLMAILGFTMQIYCDFSGYSDMAIGISSIMGFKLPKNFDFPYLSQNVTEFWHRWHITLSTWLRDYIYIPLGGNRKGKLRQYVNLMTTMLIGGLWHGAAWQFMLWGAGHGAALCVHKYFAPPLSHLPSSWWVRFTSWFITFSFVALLWVFFRADSLSTAWQVIAGTFSRFDLAYLPVFAQVRNTWCIVMVLAFSLHFLPESTWTDLRQRFINAKWWVKLVIFLIVVQLVIEFAAADIQPFIYAQF